MSSTKWEYKIKEERYIEKKLYIDNMVRTLNLINAELTDFEISKLFSNIYNPKIDAEFFADEVDSINKFIRANDVNSIIHLFELKNVIGKEVFKDMIYSKTDSILHLIINNVNNIQQPRDIYSLSDYERTAVMFAEFDYKIKHNGLRQWAEKVDDYHTVFDVDCLYDFVDDSSFEKKDEFLKMLDGISKAKHSVLDLNYNSPWYNEDKEARLISLKNYEQKYMEIEKDWNKYLEKYLLDNITEDYLTIIHNELPKGI